MPTFVFEGPDGREHEVEGPEGATPEQAFTFLQQQFSAPQASPEEQRKAELDKWADEEVAKVSKVAGVPTPSPLRGAGFGSFLDEASAALQSIPNYLTGGKVGNNYEQSLALQRARQRATEAAHPVGSVAANVVGAVGTAAATPMVKVMQGASALPTAVNMGVTGGLYNSLYGFGEGEGLEDRIDKAGKGFATGVTIGAPLGAVVGRAVSRGAPPAANPIADAAQRVGVDLPVAAAGGDGVIDRGTRQVAGALGALPIVGAPIPHAAGKAVDQMADAAARTADAYAPGVSQAGAGVAAKASMRDWVKGDSAKVMERLYADVAANVPQNATRGLPATHAAYQALDARDLAAASAVNKPAMKMVEEALTRPNGLTFEGLKQLRTNIGAMIDDSMLPAAGTSKPALKQLYGALTKDLEAMTFQLGGQKGAAAWAKANRVSKIISERREGLAKIIGKDGAKSPESTIDSIMRMAGTRSSADIGKLTLARKSMGQDAWDEVAAAIIPRLGRNSANQFSAAQFLSRYSALDDAAKNVLFSSTGKANLKGDLDALSAVATKLGNLDKLRNTSNTGAVVGLAGALGAVSLVSFPVMLAKIAGAHVMARMLAKPVKVRQVTRFGNALYQAATRTVPQIPGMAARTATTGEAILQPAITGLARAISEESGEDEREIASRIEAALRGQ
jgi:hypothetical protein